MKEYKVEKVNIMLSTSTATEIMNEYASKGWRVLRTDVAGAYLVIVFEREKETSISKSSNDCQVKADEWKCPNCNRINKNYVGTCGCGVTKTEAMSKR